MARRLDEVNTGVNAVVDDVGPVDLVFGLEVGIVSLFDVFHNRAPRIVVVDEITESGSVNHGQTETNTVLFDVGANRLDRNSLGDNVVARASAFLRGVEGGVEECVHESRLSETGLT